MSDLISRQAAIDAAIEAADEWDGGPNTERQKYIEKYIKALPTVQSEILASGEGELNVPDMNVGDTIYRQAAIDALDCINGVEEVLRSLPSAEPTITHEQAIDYLHETGWLQNHDRILTESKIVPPVQPKRMKGRWLPDNNFAYEMRFVCSVCKESEVVPTIGFTKYKPIWDFCPNCGAKMEG